MTASVKRPRLIAGVDVYRRGERVQVGLDPSRAVVASAVPPDVLSLVTGLDGRATTSDAIASVPRQRRADAVEFVDELARRGLVEDAGPPAAATVVVRGDGPVSAEMACLLAAEGVGHIVIESDGAVRRDEVGVLFRDMDVGCARREVISRLVRVVNPSVSIARPSGRAGADLVVLTDMQGADPVLVRELTTARQPHLCVRVRDGTAVVGPLVLPGRTSCLHCADLRRADLDPSWPAVAAQLAGRRGNAGPAAARFAAGLGVAHVLRLLRPATERPLVWNATVEVDAGTCDVVRRHWPAHPRCFCGAYSRTARC